MTLLTPDYGNRATLPYLRNEETYHTATRYILDPMESQSSNDGGTHIDSHLTNHNNHDGCYTASASSEPPLAACQGRSWSAAECTKVATILTACESSRPIDLLTSMATSRAGLVDDEVRRLACESMTTMDSLRGLTRRMQGRFC